ncbi:MAG: DUF1488 domain-containing protein [Beijerinckiaceae bacterium]
MALNFPNESRSYDATRIAVRFWGYDGPMEIPFFVTAEALRVLQSKAAAGECELLSAFDSHRSVIRDAADKSYKRGTRGSYALTERDF